MTHNELKSSIQETLPTLAEAIWEKFNWDLVLWFYEFLQKRNEAGGFFSKRDSDPSEILKRHILENLATITKLVDRIPVSRETKILDVGTGPGLPGFLFYCLLSTPQVTLMDSQRRKLELLEIDFIKEEKETRPSKYPLRFLYARAEETTGRYDWIVSRSTVPYPFSAEVVANLITPKGWFFPFLGRQDFDEKQETKVLQSCGWKKMGVMEIPELEFLGMRHIPFLQKEKLPLPGYPREWKKIVIDSKKREV